MTTGSKHALLLHSDDLGSVLDSLAFYVPNFDANKAEVVYKQSPYNLLYGIGEDALGSALDNMVAKLSLKHVIIRLRTDFNRVYNHERGDRPDIIAQILRDQGHSLYPHGAVLVGHSWLEPDKPKKWRDEFDKGAKIIPVHTHIEHAESLEAWVLNAIISYKALSPKAPNIPGFEQFEREYRPVILNR